MRCVWAVMASCNQPHAQLTIMPHAQLTLLHVAYRWTRLLINFSSYGNIEAWHGASLTFHATWLSLCSRLFILTLPISTASPALSPPSCLPKHSQAEATCRAVAGVPRQRHSVRHATSTV